MTLVGSKILHYRVLQELGAGGMGIVYLAEDEKLHRRVALKFLAKSIQDDPDASERLIREARAASALNHPNIVGIHAIETAPDHVFIVMEYVEGESLHSLVKRGEITWQRAVELAPQILSAIATAHDAGIVHRDIKSDNIVLTPKGQVKVLDFGLARGRDTTAYVTRAGSSAGTPAYMSPEQVQSGDVDQRSDLFSFGVVFYEMLTGRMPFKGEHEAALTYSIVNETPTAIHTHNKSVPRALENIVLKLLEKNPKDRYQGAHEVIEDLRRLETGVRVKAHPRRRSRLVAAIVAGVVLPLLAFWLVRQRASGTDAASGEPGRAMVAVLPFENLGPTDQEYFADGITEEITTQLAKMSGLGVISRTSAMQYKGSSKSLRDIGKDLGVDYVLEGSVRWDKAGNSNNVRISAQLIRINDDTHLWAENFDRVYDQIFALQSEIAQRVAEELDVTLLEPERAALATRPTKNLDAYDLYLRGREKNSDAKSLAEVDAGIAMVEQAVALDSTFARAQAYLARIYSNQFFNNLHRELPRLKQALNAAQIAMRHSANQPSGHLAMGYYHYYGSRDYARALEEFAIAQKMQPNNADVLEAMGYVQRRQGKWEEAVRNISRAVELDPKASDRASNLTQTLVYMRRWDDAKHVIDRGLEIDPTSLGLKVYRAVVILEETGDGAAAKEILDSITPKYGPIANFAAECNIYMRDYEGVHRELPNLRAYPAMDTTSYYVTRATAYFFQNRLDKVQLYGDSALAYLELKHAGQSDNAGFVAGYALVLALAGRFDEAKIYMDRASEMLPIKKDALAGADIHSSRMIYYLSIHDYEAALDEIELLLSIPSTLSPAILRAHPGFDAIRENPRFKKLAEEKASS
jgi:TolB-like protein/predicted Ser/Thr protein kinase